MFSYTQFTKGLLSFTLCVFSVGALCAQNNDPVKYDTTYYVRYPDKLIVTPFFVKPVNAFSLNSETANEPLRYFTNRPTGVGLRLGYGFFSLSGSIGLGSIDPNYSKEKGETKSLGLQTTFAGKSFLIDAYFQNYRGLYIRESQELALNNETFYIRPDIRSRLYGATGLYIFNGEKYSARPGIKFDTRQKKSAGSFMTGVEFLHGIAKGDSALVPKRLASAFPQSNIKRVNFTLFGPSIGYGHSFVVKEHFFTTLGGILNGDVTHINEIDIKNQDTKRWSFTPNFIARGDVGYNTDTWELAFSYLSNRMFFRGLNENSRYFTNNNFYRLSYTRRINAGKTVPKVVNWIGNVLEYVGLGFITK